MPADEIYVFTVTTPAGTLPTAPLVTPTVLPGRIVDKVEWRVPPGSLGVMGWKIGMRTTPVIPKNPGTFIVAHQESGTYELRNQADSGDWSVTTYNTGVNPHSLYLTYHARVIVKADPELALADDYALAGDPYPGWTGG